MTNKNGELMIVREFDAPKKIVFKAFSEAEALAQWWGPKGFPVTVVKLDFRPGGIFHFKIEAQGQTMWGRFVYGKIEEPDLLEFTNSFSDENCSITRAPFSAMWPLEIFNQLRFTEKGNKTIITMKGYPLNATEEEISTFMAAQTGLKEGFSSTFEQLDKYLDTIQNIV